ncbi:MAG: RagB/SusD family nutrient uptake outer membrane protein [Flavobacteriales bacterium]
MKRLVTYTILASTLLLAACGKNLNQSPKYGLNAEAVYSDPDNYIKVLAKLYSGMSMTGNQGPAGQADIAGIDEGFSAYVRVLWNMQELPTDEAICGWNDPGIPDLNKTQWNADNVWVKGMYYRIFYQITLCNEFIWQARDEKLNDRGFSTTQVNAIKTMRNEARFLRALAYYHAMDLFGNVPFVTEEDRVGAFTPEQIMRPDLFAYIESELKAIENDLTPATSVDYGRASASAAHALLAKMYLNAEVYTGTARYTDCATYCEKIINLNHYQLDDVYQDVFLADNHTSPEIIFPVVYDGLYAQTWGGTTFMICSTLGGTMVAADYGVNGKWAGNRATRPFIEKFTDSTEDSRWMFFNTGHQLDITSMSTFIQGYPNPKYKNKTKDGLNGSNNATSAHVDVDYPMFRLADVFLMYAEAKFRTGDESTALLYMNKIRERAYGDQAHNYSSLTLQDFLDERARELNWECTRRTDLIRFDLFTSGTYVWPFKGGDAAGSAVSDKYKLYPIPTADIVLNPNLQQNPGY